MYIMRNRVIGLVTIMSFIFVSLIYTTTAFAQSNPISILQSPQQQQQSSFCKLTESDMLGPFYKENAPFKQRLGEGVEGERLIITGNILDMSCQSLKDAILCMTGEFKWKLL